MVTIFSQTPAKSLIWLFSAWQIFFHKVLLNFVFFIFDNNLAAKQTDACRYKCIYRMCVNYLCHFYRDEYAQLDVLRFDDEFGENCSDFWK